MKKIILLSMLYAFVGKTFAQNCNTDSIENLPGYWKENPSNEYSQNLYKKFPLEAKVLGEIHKNVIKNFKPKGAEAFFAYTLVGSLNEDVLNHAYQYFYVTGPAPFYCAGNKVMAERGPTRNKGYIYVNNPGTVFTREVMGNVALSEKQRDHYGWLTSMPEFKNGAWFLGEHDIDDKWEVERKAEWLVTYDGKLPFSYVTRKEYLEKVKEKLSIKLEQNIASTKDIVQIRPKAEQEKEKNDMVEMFVKGSARANKYLAEYKTDEQKLEESIKKDKENYSEAIKIVNNYLAQPETELQKTAIITSLTSTDFTGFARENDQYALIVVKDNPAYFNPKLAKDVPQTFYISWTLNYKRPVVFKFYTDMMKNFDFAALKNLLGE
jgi:hypothetical protein